MDPASLSSLIAELFAAIQLLSGYAPPTVLPAVHRVPQTAIQEQLEMNSASRVSMTGWAARCGDAEVPTPTRQ
jgi:hypothetical protein